MVPQISLLVALIMLIDRIPLPEAPFRRGRPKTYTDRLFLKALVIRIVRRLPKGHSLLAVLAEPTPEMQHLLALIDPWQDEGAAAAIDSTPLRAHGGGSGSPFPPGGRPLQ